jgi:dUTPase
MIYELTRNVKLPERANPTDSWIDFFIPDDLQEFYSFNSFWEKNTRDVINWELYINAWERILIPLGIKIQLDEWMDLTFVNKSWIASKTWLIVWACLIDNSYRWELMLNLISTRKDETFFKVWTKIIQWVIRKVEYVNPKIWEIDINTDRWDWWFGSTWI